VLNLGRCTAALVLILCGACASEEEAHPEVAPSASASSPIQTGPTLKRPPRPTYHSSVRRLTADERAAMTGVSWRPGCPVPLERLRRVTLSHWDFSGTVRRGVLIVRADVADEVAEIFGRLFRDRFPIRRMVPVDEYDADDFTSIEADNTSAFNCRPATGSTEWSHHAYGLAIDINPIENPYVLDGRTIHRASEPYLDRSRERPGVLVDGGPVVRAFKDAGWYWGGEWTNPVDYQHFSKLPED
jgi:hypothetical protein